MTPAERALRSRLGGLTKAARHDPRQYTTAARTAWKASGHTECRLCGSQPAIPADLPLAEQERRRQARLSAHYARMAYSSVRSRKKGRPRRDTGPALEVVRRAAHDELPPAA
jgi:hypothetical protein